ncbi:MAG: pyridoxamine 5'-phosphate oxidase family protein [Rhodobiaceae bacterium]|nr:pyridoxamine 5'-phosphate oxidase family protein [Rhodobiaceae bacterium]MCC0013499.1 pyridoxamine 5'-phosphate oxidase family protein [Rhodobiaceae bacterium]MCC0018112.1 pyridoxamine 5'-phosphate oxidase family protein [Rhodobiaceae bacterium]MCC0050598.1 pyridoxamine 5'-phosphate oxidase family protein [Rhodobiaceae bacterium]MCC0059801.1 pyridoxamine 5'-phosphate oxidase family protein [Rhodobiaceae bacterium]
MTEARLRELYGEATPRAAAKVIRTLDRHCREFIANSPFLVIATSDGETLDASPKGDPAGFVIVEDDTHLLLPDRPGNNRIDGMLNILRNPKVALLFLIPSVNETLRINGHATIHDDPELCERGALNGRAPKTVMRIAVEEIFVHCGKAPLRAGLWKPESWPASRPVATLNEIVRDHAQMEVGATDQAAVDEMYARTLY